ncbi:heavy metal translocating P-type ATPase [Burkholderia multivorans]|uniref:heavy metal translocating P-type ATPase n=1 Tax=Burkholderia multivorans TaxID=87883 RepID=UPI003735AB91
MSHFRWSIDSALLAIAAVTLAGGGVCAALGSPALARTVWLLGTWPVLLALVASVAKAVAQRRFGVDVLAGLAIGLAMALDEALTAAVIALMLASGRTLEQYAQRRAQREMTALLGRAPRHATRFEDGQWRAVPLDTVRPGDRMLVRSGECVAVDGTLTGGAELDESMLTGESSSVSRRAGERVCSGVLNAGAPFEMVARTTAGDSTFAGIVRMVERAQRERSPAVRLADRYAGFFLLVSLAVAGIAWLSTGDVTRVLAVLVVASPCPLILAVPVAIVSGMSRCSKWGVLVKDGGALERLAQATVLFFDKTGTLTGGRARIVSIDGGPTVDADDVLHFAASLAQASGHVISDALTVAARERHVALSSPSAVVEAAGEGVTGRVDGRLVAIGKFDYVCSHAAAAGWSDAFARRVASLGGAAVFVGVDGATIGAIHLADQLRLETPRALRLLKRAGIGRLVMLTGDRRDIAESIGELLGVADVRAEQTPADKLAAIRAARREGVAIMVGDGINDAPALAAADVGVAMGARGAAASSEAADVVLLVDRLDRLVDAIAIARRSRRIAGESVAVGMSLSIAAMLIAAFGFLPPIAGAVAQEVIDVVVIVNALRVSFMRSPAVHVRDSAIDFERLKREHSALSPLIDRIGELADRLPKLSGAAATDELARVIGALNERLVPHEKSDDGDVYPRLAPLLGGDDPLAAMSNAHREIFRMVRSLMQIVADLPSGGPDAAQMQTIQRLLYGLEAIVRLHCAQEEELFHAIEANA